MEAKECPIEREGSHHQWQSVRSLDIRDEEQWLLGCVSGGMVHVFYMYMYMYIVFCVGVEWLPVQMVLW